MFTRSTYVIRYITHSSPRTTDVGGGRLNFIIGAAPAARGATPSAFERRCIPPPPQRGCRVGDPGPGGAAPPSHTSGMLGRRALPVGRIAALGATMDLHHGLLVVTPAVLELTGISKDYRGLRPLR